jgi:hypothetical protein
MEKNRKADGRIVVHMAIKKISSSADKADIALAKESTREPRREAGANYSPLDEGRSGRESRAWSAEQ